MLDVSMLMNLQAPFSIMNFYGDARWCLQDSKDPYDASSHGVVMKSRVMVQ